MSRATPPRGERPPTRPRAVPEPSRLEAWLAVALCGVVLLASTAILERSRSYSRSLFELEHPSGRAPRSTATEVPRAARLVLLFALDGLRADRLADAPGLADLAARSVDFGTVLAPAAHALAAHKALLTGRYFGSLVLQETGADLVELAAVRRPEEYLVEALTRVEPELAESFRSAGFRTAAFTDGARVGRRTGFAAGFETFEEGLGFEAALQRARGWLDSARREPAFLFVQSSELVASVEGSSGTLAPETARQRYDARLAELDREFAEFLTALRARGLFEPALIAFTAGHGLSLGERGAVGSGGLALEQLLVPLLLKFPQEAERAPARLSQPVELVDLAPTLLEAAGLPRANALDGRSLLGIVRAGERGRDCLIAESVLLPGAASAAARTFVRPGRWQVTHDPSRDEASVADLRTDPQALAPRPLDAQEVPALLARLLARTRSTRTALRPEAAPSAALATMLEELGYAGAPAAFPDPDSTLR